MVFTVKDLAALINAVPTQGAELKAVVNLYPNSPYLAKAAVNVYQDGRKVFSIAVADKAAADRWIADRYPAATVKYITHGNGGR